MATSLDIQWVRFDNSLMKIAFLASTNQILLSESLRDNNSSVDAVLLEEFGHWLESGVGAADSKGDEGYLFSNLVRGLEVVEDHASDSRLLEINGRIFRAELATPTATVAITEAALSDTTNTSVVTITFSEAVTGFANADVTVVGGTLSTLGSTDGGTTWTGTIYRNG